MEFTASQVSEFYIIVILWAKRGVFCEKLGIFVKLKKKIKE